MENTISLPKPEYTEKMTEFAKDPKVYNKKKNIQKFDKLLDKGYLDKYFSFIDKDNKKN